MNKAKRTAYLGLFLALALTAAFLESLIPINPGIPGIKLGLANVVTMCLLYLAGLPACLGVTVARILLSGFLFGNVFSIIYSLAGAALSILVMCLLKKTDYFSMVGVSIAGGTAHNIGQILVAIPLLEAKSLVYYLPVLVIAGLASGAAIGFVSALLTRRLIPFFPDRQNREGDAENEER